MKAVAATFLSLNASDTTDTGYRWVQLIPQGRMEGRDGRGPYQLKDAQRVIDATKRRAGSALLPVDYEHQTEFTQKNGQPAPAAGWIGKLEARPDGIWGQLSWTDRAAAHIRAGEYKYISPVFRHKASGDITLLLRAALTNNPNLEMNGVAASANDSDNVISELREILKLPADAALSTIVAKIRELVEIGTTSAHDATSFVPIEDFERVTEAFNKLNKGVDVMIAGQHVEGVIEKGKLPPFLRDWGVALCTANMPAFNSFVERTAGHYSHLFGDKTGGRNQVGFASAHASQSADGLSEDELSVCRRLGLRPEDYANHAKTIEANRARERKR